jgi:hypothetical protein
MEAGIGAVSVFHETPIGAKSPEIQGFFCLPLAYGISWYYVAEHS